MFSIFIISCEKNLNAEDVTKIEHYFSDWENKVVQASSAENLIRLQLEFNKETINFLQLNLGKNITQDDRVKVWNTFKFHHSNLNLMFASKLDSALKEAK